MIEYGSQTALQLGYYPHAESTYGEMHSELVNAVQMGLAIENPSAGLTYVDYDDYIDTENSSDSELDQVLSKPARYVMFDTSSLLSAIRVDVADLSYWETIADHLSEIWFAQSQTSFKFYAHRAPESNH